MDLGSLLGQLAQNYTNVPQNQSDVEQYSQGDVYNHYQQYAQQASPEQLQQAHEASYQQMPEPQRQSILSSIVGALQQHGVNPQEAGIQENNPSPSNLAQATQYVAQKPDLMQSVFGKGGALSSSLAKMALVGALAYAANNITKQQRR